MNLTSRESRDSTLPLRLRCGVSYQWRNGGGYLNVAPDTLIVEFTSLMKAVGTPPTITHKAKNVKVIRARLWPPMFNTGIVVCGDNGATAIHMWSWFQYPRVRGALEKAGFIVEEETRWISRGEQLARDETRRLRS